jgi:hypothetical protein
VSGNDRHQISVREGHGDQIEIREQSEDRAGMAHAAVKVGTAIGLLLRFLVLVIMMANVLGHRITLVLTARTRCRCSGLQRYYGDQHEGKKGAHAPEFTSFDSHDSA